MFLKQCDFYPRPARSRCPGLATCSTKLCSLSCFQLRSRGLQSAAILDYAFHRAVGLDAAPREILLCSSQAEGKGGWSGAGV